MMTRSLGFLFLLIAVNLEAVAQLFFKLATRHDQHHRGSAISFWHTLRNPATTLGVAAFIANMAFYTVALQSLDLSIAFPAEGLALIVVTLLSRAFLGEVIRARRWWGILLVMLGGILVGLG